MDLVRHLHQRCGKVGIITDNAGALTGRDVRKCLDDAGGDVEMPHLPPRTPQLNPIEVEWREIRAAIADIFFGGLDKMRDAIRRGEGRSMFFDLSRDFAFFMATMHLHNLPAPSCMALGGKDLPLCQSRIFARLVTSAVPAGCNHSARNGRAPVRRAHLRVRFPALPGRTAPAAVLSPVRPRLLGVSCSHYPPAFCDVLLGQRNGAQLTAKRVLRAPL